MKACNWIIADAINKKADIVFYIKTAHFNGIITKTEKLSELIEAKTANYKELCNIWASLPENFKHLNNKNLGVV